ncbi:MAG: HlyD family secretion protein [Cyanobacteria bacterium RYN_339]|nr:HlyD family secretion protein [Cyanobacteria bacterium RYN_339]
MSLRRLHAPLAACLAVALLATGGCKKDKPKQTEAPSVLTVAAEPATVKPLPRKLDMTGSVAAWDPLPVMPAAQGLRIMRVAVEEGDVVSKGQLLAQLDDESLQAQLSAARARSSSAQAQLAKMRQPSRRQDYRSSEAALAQAEAQVASARDAYNRFKELQTEGGVSEADLVTRQTALNAAIATAEQARQRLSLTREGSRPEDIRIAEASAAEARASVRQIEAALDQTRVVAPAAGQIIKRDAHLGDVASPGKALFQMVRDSRLEVQATVPETDLAKVSVGQSVDVSSDARPDLHATGKIRIISPSVDATSRQAMVKIDLPVGSGFQVGNFVRAQAQLGDTPSLVVPAAAVVTKESGSEVFVLDGNLAKARKVVPGTRSGGLVAINDGLKAGEKVITAGVGFLKDGDKVDVAPALAVGTDAGASTPASPMAPAPSPSK